MHFQVLGEISYAETFAVGSGIREIARLRKLYGKGRWRKRKGIARVRLDDGRSFWPKSIGMKLRALVNGN